ncbi:hypothetical protein WJX73_002647 [Symbiochloris irregularis]|uniref:Nucleolus and neural progenitor protein-like N-terminal domain-containing protein n=1 Tax=Symbiochloris irregularis TaxID=706552 RepID=A0AAW1PG23_9CHLO
MSVSVSHELLRETALLDKLVKKNCSQHRGTSYFKRLLEVQRYLHLLQQLAAASGPTLEQDVRRQKPGPRLGSADPLSTGKVHLGSMCTVEKLMPCLLAAAAQLSAQLSMAFFVPFCIVAFAMLARVQVLTAKLMLDTASRYNALMTTHAACLRACSGSDHGATVVPALVKVQWQGHLPSLVCMDHMVLTRQDDTSQEATLAAQQPAGLTSLAAEHEDLGVRIARPPFPAAAAAVITAADHQETYVRPAQAKEPGRSEQQPTAMQGRVRQTSDSAPAPAIREVPATAQTAYPSDDVPPGFEIIEDRRADHSLWHDLAPSIRPQQLNAARPQSTSSPHQAEAREQ